MRVIKWMAVALLAGTLAVVADNTGTDPAHKYAWGENVGWLNAQSAVQEVTVHYYEETGGWLSGYAWGENIGWLKFKGTSPDYGVRSMAFYTQPQGTPNWWLDSHDVTEGYDAGDGVAAWRKYVMDTDPTVMGDFLHITAVSNAPAGTAVAFTPASTQRTYTLKRRADLTTGAWSNVAGQIDVPGAGGEQSMMDAEPAAARFCRVNVKVTP